MSIMGYSSVSRWKLITMKTQLHYANDIHAFDHQIHMQLFLQIHSLSRCQGRRRENGVF